MNKKDLKAIKDYIEARMTLIQEARAKVVDAGGHPTVVYIGDIFPRKKGQLRASAMLVHTGCTVLGMQVIADYRVPKDQVYITQGELKK